MWMLPQQSVIMTKAVKSICMATSVHSNGNSLLYRSAKPPSRQQKFRQGVSIRYRNKIRV